MTPSVYVRYNITSTTPINLLQGCTKSVVEPVFHLNPLYYAKLQFNYELNPYNAFFASILLPIKVNTPTVIFRSDILTITNRGGPNPSIFRISADKSKVESLHKLSRWDVTYIPSTSRYVDMTIDTNLILNIRYVVVEPALIKLELYGNIIKIVLKEPVSPLHLSTAMIVNEPTTAEEGKPLSIISLSMYSVDEEEWDSMPITASTFSLSGSHIGPERGLYSMKERRTANPRSQLVIGTANQITYPWHELMQTEERLDSRSSAINISEFMFYNEHSCFDKCIQWDYEKENLLLGSGSRFGTLYWKYAHRLQGMQVDYSLSLLNSIRPITIWWISTTALPKHHLITVIASELENRIRMSSEAMNIDANYVVQSSFIGLILYKQKDGTVQFRYAYLTTRPRDPETDRGKPATLTTIPILSVSEATPITPRNDQGDLVIHVSIDKNNLAVQIDGENALNNFALPYAMTNQVTEYAIAGFVGRSSMISKYEVSTVPSSDTSETSGNAGSTSNPNSRAPSFLLVPSTDLVIYKAALMYRTSSFNATPCNVIYRDRVAYGSTDPLLNNPPTYNMQGNVFIHSRGRSYGLIANDEEKKTMCYIEFHTNPNCGSSFIAVNRGLGCSIKRMAERINTEASCFANNRLQRYESCRGGLINFNNTCFQNSTIQFLFHSDLFKRSLLQFYNTYVSSGLSGNNDNFRCMHALVQMMTRLQVSVRGGEFNNLMLVLQKQFDIGYQHVSIEYY